MKTKQIFLLIIILIGILTVLGTANTEVNAAPEIQRPSPDSIRFENISVEDGLSHETVRAIFQDREGFLWFGTLDGLNKYNGYEITIYRHDKNNPNSLLDNNILSIFEDHNQSFWIGTSRGLDLFDRENRTFSHFQHDPNNPYSLSGRGVTSIFEDHAGNLWIGTTNGGLNLYDSENNRFIHFSNNPANPQSISSNAVQVIFEDENNILWVGTVNGLNAFNPQTGIFTRYSHNPDNDNTLAAPSVTAIAASADGNLWIGTQGGGMALFDPNTRSFLQHLHNPDNSYTISGNLVNSIVIDRKGRYWVGSNGGLDQFTLENYIFTHYPQLPQVPHRQIDEAVSTIFEDRSGILWFASALGGVSKYNPADERFTIYEHIENHDNSLSNNDISAICETEPGTIWVGTFNGGLNRLDLFTNTIKNYHHDPEQPESIADDEIRALLLDHTGMLWIGMVSGGLDCYDPTTDTFTHHRYSPNDHASLSENQITALHEDSSGNIWIGTFSGGLNKYNRETNEFTRYIARPNSAFSLNDNHILSIYEDHKGLLWIGTWNGINVFNPETRRFTHYVSEPENNKSLSENATPAFYEDNNGTMWIATSNGGLNRFDRETETFLHYTQLDGLPSNTINGILPSPDGKLWLSTDLGLSCFDPSTKSFQNYDIRDGLQGNQFNPGAHFLSSQGEIFFGGTQGMTAFFPMEIQQNPNIPPIVITRFSTLDQIISTNVLPEEQFQIPHTENYISIEFAALEYSIPERNQYAYMLEGVDEDWVYTQPIRRYDSQTNIFEGVYRDWYYTPARRKVDYTNLNPGTYTFRVKGSNSDGIWNKKGAEITITIVPPLWERSWFQAITVIIGAVVLVSGWTFRTSRIKKRRQLLENALEERTSIIERRQKVAEGLRDILTSINSDQPLDEILNFIVIQSSNLLISDSCIIHRYDRTKQVANIQSRYGLPTELDILESYPLGITRWTNAILNRESHCHSNISAELSNLPFEENEADQSWMQIIGSVYQACLTVPLIVQENVYGSLTFFFSEPQEFNKDDLEIATEFAKHAALAIENANLRSQAEQTAIAAERSRLARDLHDAVTQTLFSASLIAEVIPRVWETDPDEGKALLKDLRQLTRGALAEMRSMLLELRPAALVELELGDLLKQLSDAFSGRADIPVFLTVNNEADIPPHVKITLYRIAQESLNNIAKHARATKINITLNCNEGHIELHIQDDGIGFNPTRMSADHLGIKIMKERAENIGADFDIISSNIRGTEISVQWPSASEI